MSDKIIVIDFSGTLIKANIAEEANIKRYEQLGLTIPSEEEHKKMHGTKSHYDILREKIKEKYGLEDDLQITFSEFDGDDIMLSGKQVQTVIMTDMFRDAMYALAKEKDIFTLGIIDAAQKLKDKGFKLAIVSGIRTDIITGMLAITKCPVEFDYILSQDPALLRDSNKLLTEELSEKGDIVAIIGDKKSDLEPAKKLGAKAIFLKGGHPTGGEEEIADVVVENANEIAEKIE